MPTTTLSVDDTLCATVQVYNQTSDPETLYADYEYFNRWLKNSRNDTIMDSYGAIPLGEYLVIDSHQSKKYENIASTKKLQINLERPSHQDLIHFKQR